MTQGSGPVPGSGHSLTGSSFEGDLGAADARLLAALDHQEDESALMRALAHARLLVPIVAEPADSDPEGDREAGLEPEEITDNHATEMAVVTLTSPDGQRGLPVFSSIDTLGAWDVTARPSPATSSRAAQSAVTERCDVMVLDLGSEHQAVLRPSMVWALAQQREWLPAHIDPFVAQALVRATAGEADVVDCVGEEGDPAGAGILRVVLRLRPGLDQAQVQALATRVGEQIATDGEARARIDDLTFTIRQA